MKTKDIPTIAVPDHELLRVIGRGSYGEVWQARNVMGTMRAVKVVQRQDFEFSRPFDREFEGIQRYEPFSRSHDGLVQVLHVGMGRARDHFYYVMEVADDVEGREVAHGEYQPRTLRDQMCRNGALPVTECIEIGIALASALGYLHRNGLVHRDVKPSNIIFVNNRAKLADVGLVALMSDTRSMVGTEGFVAPEGTGQPRSDVYSLGKVLYECVSGFDRLRFPDVPDQWVGSPDARAAFEFLEIVLRAAETDPKRRYEGTEEMLADLAMLQAGKSLRQMRRMETRLRRSLHVLAIATLGVAVAGGAWYYERGRRERIEEAERTAVDAQRETRKLLGESLVAGAHALRLSGQAGAREHALAAAEKARAAGADPMTLRSEAASALGMLDVGTFAAPWPAFATSRSRTVISEDGAFLATCSPEGEARIYLRGPGSTPPELTATFSIPAGEGISDLALSRNGLWLGACHADRRLSVWNVSEGKKAWEISDTEGVPLIAFAADSSWFVTSAGGTLIGYRFDSAEPVELATGLPPLRQLLLSPDATWIAALGEEEKGFRIFSGLSGTCPSAGEAGRIRSSEIESDMELRGASISGDSRYLAAAVGEDRLRVWEMPSMSQLAWLRGHQRTVRSTAFHPHDSTLVASTSWDGTVRFWDIPTRQQVMVAPVGGEDVLLLPERNEIVVRSWSRDSLRIAPLSAPRGMRVLMLPPLTPFGLFSSVEFSPDGRLIVAAGDAGVIAWDPEHSDMVRVEQPREQVWRDAVFSPDGSELWTSGFTGLWKRSIRRNDAGRVTLGESRQVLTNPVTDVDWSGSSLALCNGMAFAGGSGAIQLVEPSGEVRQIPVPGFVPDRIAASPDGRWLAVTRYPAAGGSLIDRLHRGSGPVDIDAPSRCTFTFLRRDPVLAVGTDRDVRFAALPGRDLPSAFSGRIERPQTDFIPSRVAISKDGSVAAVSTGPTEVTLYAGAGFRKLVTLESQLTPFDCSLALSPDGSRLLLAGGVSRVVVWDVAWLRDELIRRGFGWDD